MPFTWKAYLELAHFLYSQAVSPSAEAAYRSAVSRAYYAAFCHVRNYARDQLGFTPRYDADDHGRLRAFLNKGKTRILASRLDRLRQWRNECDYLNDLQMDIEQGCVLALSEADRVFQSLPS